MTVIHTCAGFMSLLQIFIISIVQGITEWLPVSSSAHVLLAASYFGYEGRDELLINAVANFGTVASMLIYFRKEIGEAIFGVFALPGALGAKRELTPGERLAMNLLASLPLTIFGLAIARLFIPDEVNEAVRSVHGVAIPLIVFGILLGLADIYGARTRTINDMPPLHAVLIGAVQVIAAILPGTSRSGITMTTARALGYSRPEAAKFGMLVGAPVLSAVGLYAIYEFYFGSEVGAVTVTGQEAVLIGAGSFVSGLVAIYILMALVRRMSFLPFVAYRLVLGIALLTMMPLPMVAG